MTEAGFQAAGEINIEDGKKNNMGPPQRQPLSSHSP